jgi:Mg/Co/Ni transporter MgtE
MNDIINRDILDEAATVDARALATALAQEHATDIVERLNAASPETSSVLLELQHRERAVALLKAMSADRAADVFRHRRHSSAQPE